MIKNNKKIIYINLNISYQVRSKDIRLLILLTRVHQHVLSLLKFYLELQRGGEGCLEQTPYLKKIWCNGTAVNTTTPFRQQKKKLVQLWSLMNYKVKYYLTLFIYRNESPQIVYASTLISMYRHLISN